MHNRREILTGMTASIAGLQLPTILGDPKLAHAAASLPDHAGEATCWGSAEQCALRAASSPQARYALLQSWGNQ